MKDARAAIREFSDACVRCGLCARCDCGNYAPGTPNLGDICDSLLSDDETWRHFPFTCALCNRCTVHCPAGLHAADVSMPLRVHVLPGHPELRPLYRKFRTDMKYNLFSMLAARERGDASAVRLVEGCADLGGEADACAFFPGCSLYAYAPALTAEVFGWLRDEGIASRMLTFCCGATFVDCGFYDEFDRYREDALAFLREQGIERLVVTCPHCLHRLPDLLEGADVDLLRLPDLLAERGKLASTAGAVSFHDACYDRLSGAFGQAARALFPASQLVALEHEREESYCCGGGGMVSVYAPDYCTWRRNQRLAEIDAVKADRVLSTCFSCVNSLQRGVGSTPVQHYLEPVFGEYVDWSQVYANVDALMADPQAQALYECEDTTFG